MENPGPADRHIAGLKRRLAHLGGLAHKTAAADRAILEGASARLEAVNADLAKLAPRAIADGAAGDDYQAKVLERGQLHHVIATARAALGR